MAEVSRACYITSNLLLISSELNTHCISLQMKLVDWSLILVPTQLELAMLGKIHPKYNNIMLCVIHMIVDSVTTG